MTDEKAQEKKQPKPPSNTMEWIISGVIGLGSGLARIVKVSNAELHRKMLDYADKAVSPSDPFYSIKQMQEDHKVALGDLHQQRFSGNIGVKEYINKSRNQKDSLAKALDTFSADPNKMGFRSNSIFDKDWSFSKIIENKAYIGDIAEGTMQRCAFMGKHTRNRLLSDVAIATVIGVAGPIMFFNSLNIHSKLNELRSQHSDKNI